MVVVSDRKISVDAGNDGITDYFTGEVLSANDYYSFGGQMPGRSFTSSSYRYGFNGKENDKETNGEGGTQDYGMRIYNPSLGRFLSVDPLTASYPSWSPYPFAMSRPIDGSDLDGCEWKSEHKWSDKITDKTAIETLGSNYVEGMTYADAWKVRSPEILKAMYDEKQVLDCFDAAATALIQYAYENKLTVHIQDHKSADKSGRKDPTFNNNKYGYTDKTGKKIKFKEGDWKAFAKAIAADYGAADAGSNRSLFTEDGGVEWEPGMLGTNGRHVLTVVEYDEDWWNENDVYYIQGNTDHDHKAIPMESKEKPESELKDFNKKK